MISWSFKPHLVLPTWIWPQIRKIFIRFIFYLAWIIVNVLQFLNSSLKLIISFSDFFSEIINIRYPGFDNYNKIWCLLDIKLTNLTIGWIITWELRKLYSIWYVSYHKSYFFVRGWQSPTKNEAHKKISFILGPELMNQALEGKKEQLCLGPGLPTPDWKMVNPGGWSPPHWSGETAHRQAGMSEIDFWK